MSAPATHAYNNPTAIMDDLQSQLQQLFGLDHFRPAQREVIEDVLAGRDVLCVMPTGAGKSLCYQFPAALQGGLTLVVSPLISLMHDQVQQLQDEGIHAAMINSTLDSSTQRKVLRELEAGFDGLFYVSPERFYTPSFHRLLGRLKPKLFAIDEAHCISTWGHDFRPEYSRLGEIREKLGAPPTVALTATATDDVRADIIRLLGLREPRIYVTGFDRPNLRYESRTISRLRDKNEELINLIRGEAGSGIVYCATRNNVDEVATLLRENLSGRPIFSYHAGLDQEQRTRNQDLFMETPSAIAVATNAFGMGINKPDIRLVVHYNIPGTLEAYYQEAGRAGRDGRSSRCALLFSYQDRYVHEFFINKLGEEGGAASGASAEEEGNGGLSSLAPDSRGRATAGRTAMDDLKSHALEKLDLVIRYAQTHRCRRQQILDYFGDESEVSECDCDVCRRERGGTAIEHDPAATMSDEVITLTRKLLAGIARVSMRGQFGVGIIAEVLAGSDTEKTRRWNFEGLSVFGLLRVYQVKQVVAMLHRLMEAGLARQRDPDGMKFRPVVELTAAGVAVMKGEQPPPATLSDLIGRQPAPPVRVSISPQHLTNPTPDELDAEALTRFERLRSVRMNLAKERQLPPYCICHDSTLKLIARFSPPSLAALESIKGMGPNKIRLYGPALLSALQQPASEER